MKRLNIKQTVLAAALAVGAALTAAADPITYTWTGASGENANWSNSANWDQGNGKVPGTSDWAIIPASSDGQPWQITIDKTPSKPADFYAAGSTLFSGGFTLNAQVNGASGNGVLSQGKMEVTGEKTAASFSGVNKTAPMKLASDASYLASEGGSITFGYLCFDASKDISFVASNQNSKVTLSTMWTNAGGTAQPNLNENNTGLFFGAYDGGLLTLSPDLKFVTGNDPTFIANGGKIVASKTQATTADAVLNVTSTNAGVVVFGALKGSTHEFCSGEGSIITNNGAVTGNPKVICNDKGTVRFTGAITGNPEFDCSGQGTVMLANGSGALQKITGGAKLTCSDEGSLIQMAGIGKAGENTTVTATKKGSIIAGATLGSVTLVADKGATAELTSSMATGTHSMTATDAGTLVWVKGGITGDTTIDASNMATVQVVNASAAAQGITGAATMTAENGGWIKTGKVTKNVSLKADGAGSFVDIASTAGAAGTSSFVTATNNGVVQVESTITGAAVTLAASEKGTIKLVNAAGTTYQKITGATTITCTDEGSAVQLAGFGVAGQNSLITATDKGTVLAGASLGNVSIAADKGAEVKLTSTMATGNHTIACSNEDSVVWIQNTVTGNPVITCEDKGTVKLMKADNASLIGVSGYPTVMCSGEGSSVTMGNLGATAAGVNVLKAKDGATVTVGTTKFTIQAEASNGALLKMGSMTPSADNNEIVADNATIQFTGAMNGNKSFTSVYEVKGADGLIEGVKANLLFGSDAKTTVKLMPLRSRSSAFIKTTTSGDITFGAGVKYVVDVSDVSQDVFYGDKKFLIAESAGKLTFNAPTSVTVTGAEPEYYSASLAAEGTKLYVTVTSKKVPEGKVAVVGIDKFYATLGEAVENVENGGLIGVMTDVAVAEKIANPEGKTVTLNLNGNTLTSELTDCVIDNAGTLVLKGAGAIASETAGVLIINRPTGVLTIEDGTYTCAKVLENLAQEENLGAVTVATAVFNGTTENCGSLSSKGGTFGALANNGTLTITAGTYGTLTNNGVLSISGGAFTGNEYALYNCCTATVSSGTFDGIVACDGEVGALEITGGTFKSEVVAKADSAEIAIAGLVGVSLNKATFAVDETAYCEDGYLTFKNGDVYIVRRATDVVITPVNANAEFGTLTVENAGSQISELGVTLRGTITNVKTGLVPVVLIGGQRVDIAQDGSFEGPAVASAEVVAAYVKADAWYLDPFVRNTFTLRSTYSPIGTIMDEDETFIAQNGDPGSDNYGIASVFAQVARTSVNPKLGYIWNRGSGTGGKVSSYRQMAVSSYHQAVFGCPWYASDNAVYVVPFDPAKEVTNVQIDWGEMENLSSKMFWGFPIGEKIYYQNGSKNVNGEYDIYQFTVVKDGDVITGLKADGLVGSGADGAHGLLVDGVPYAYTWDSGSVKVVNLADGSVTTNLIDGSVLSTVRRTQITGVADGIPHLVLHGDKGIGIYALAADMRHLVSSTPIAYLLVSSMTGGTTFAGTTAFDDEKTYVLCNSSGKFHIFEHKPAQLIVRGTFSDEANAEEDALVDFGTDAAVTWAAPKGYLISAVKVDGTAVSGWAKAASYTYAKAALDKNVYVEMTLVVDPVAKIGTAEYGTLQGAFDAVKDGETVQVVKDVTEDTTVAVSGKNFTLDLNGKTLTFDLQDYSMTLVSTTLTITDSSLAKDGAIVKTREATMITIDKNSKVTLEAGTVKCTATSCPTGSTGANFKVEGEFVMNGGTVDDNGQTFQWTLSMREGGKATINGGTLIGDIQEKGSTDVTIPAASTAKFSEDHSKYCATGYMTDDSQDGSAAPYFVGAKVAITYDYGAGTAPETANKAAFAAYAADRTFTLAQPTAPTGKKFKEWTADGEGVTFAGDVMTIPADFAPTFTVTATYESAGPEWPVDWSDVEADDAVKMKFAAWRAGKGADADLSTDAAKNAFLLNVAVDGIKELKIESIEVDAEGYATIVVGTPGMWGFAGVDLKDINGVLSVEAGETLGGMAPKAVTYWTTTSGKANIKVKANFIKVVIGFKTLAVDAVQPPKAE